MSLPPLITLEEHYLSSAVTNYYATLSNVIPLPESHLHVMKLLRELGQSRLSSMNSGRVSLQIISHRPNAIPIPSATCSAANDELATAVADSPDPSRFRAFAMLPTSEPEKCHEELERCIRKHSFVGSLLDNTTSGRYYDDPFFWPILKAHVELDVPLYLHPAMQPDLLPILYKGNYDPLISTFLANHGFGWHFSTALHILRLFAARVFDTFPTLRIIVGHMGEMLPFQLDRICRLAKTWPPDLQPTRDFRTVWDESIFLTTAGMFSLGPMSCVLRQCKISNVMYSVDYPFASNEEGLEFMSELQSSGLVDEEQFARIAHKNAEMLLRIQPPRVV